VILLLRCLSSEETAMCADALLTRGVGGYLLPMGSREEIFFFSFVLFLYAAFSLLH